MVNENEIMFKGNPNISYPKAPGRGLSFKCFKCPSIFDRKEALLTHSSLHGSLKKFQCHNCDYAVNSPELLSKHMEKHLSSSPSTSVPDVPRQTMSSSSSPAKPSPSSVQNCSECPATFANRTNLLAHLANHRNQNLRPHKCTKCSFATNREYFLEKHLLVHGISMNSESTVSFQKKKKRKPTTKRFTCPECPELLRNRRDLGRHLRKHNGEKGKFQCPTCSFSINRPESLESHLLLHDKNYGHTTPKASVDSPVWIESKSMTDDDRTVAADEPYRSRPYQCSKCPFKGSSRSDMEHHMTAHSNLNGTYKCSYCDYNTNNYTFKFKHEQLHQKQGNWNSSQIASKITLQAYKKYRIRKDGISSPSLSVSEEEYERIRKGNPAIKYKPFLKINRNGNRKAVTSFKCLKCPYQTSEYAVYVGHQGHHGANEKFQCTMCDYSSNGKKKLRSHLQLHSYGTSGAKTRGSLQPKLNVEPAVIPKSPQKARRPIIQRVTPQTYNSKDPVNSSTSSLAIPTAVTKSFSELYSNEPSDNEQANRNKFLIQGMKVNKFMCIDNLDLSTTNILTFQGVGKSASLSALLIGLGYDLLADDFSPTMLCGINVEDFIQKGCDESTIELTLSLHSAPKLQREYGSHLTLIRTLQRGLPLTYTNFKITSADNRGQFPKNFETIGRQRIRRIQKHIGMKPEFYRLLLVDEINLHHLLQDTSCWYNFYRLTYDSRKKKFETRLELLRLKYKRLQGEMEWRNVKKEFLGKQMNKSQALPENICSGYDDKDLNDVTVELEEMYETQNALLNGVNSYLNELNKLPNVLTGRLKFRYQEFLHRQDYTGSILVDDKLQTLGIWIVKERQEVTPKTVEEAESFWVTTPSDLKRLAVIGLFFALIDIAESSIFFIDAASTRSSQFCIPSTAFPLLFELIEKKCSQGHQFVTSLPNEDDTIPMASN